ncbi:hypothetical protein ACUNG2_05120 [Serratia sp. IR-2025]
MFDEKKFMSDFDDLEDDEIDYINAKMEEESNRQYTLFKESYLRDECYLCGKDFKTISKENPCLHWLLRRCKFKTKDFHLIYKKYGYTNIAAFLRWCANMEKPIVNINDMTIEEKKEKIISNTIKWKNVEWTFDCSESDFKGHSGKEADFPHYHFQMRIDGFQFINFNSYHLPLHNDDIFAITMSRAHPEKFHYNFGDHGSGMNFAMELISDDPEVAFEHMTRADNEEEAVYHMSTTVMANEGETISGDLIADLIDISKKTGEPLGSLLYKNMPPSIKVQTIVSPSDQTPEIAVRTEHKKR